MAVQSKLILDKKTSLFWWVQQTICLILVLHKAEAKATMSVSEIKKCKDNVFIQQKMQWACYMTGELFFESDTTVCSIFAAQTRVRIYVLFTRTIILIT